MSMTPAQKAAFHMRKHEIDAAIAACTNEGDYRVLVDELQRRANKRIAKFGQRCADAIERLDVERGEYTPPRVDVPRYSDHGVDDPGAWPESSADLYTPPEPWPDEAYTRPGDEPEPVVAAFATLHRANGAPLTISERRRARMAAK
jgi:hypothetical protein